MLEGRAVPATYTVTDTNDGGTGSLRQAILIANATTAKDDIVFDASAFATSWTNTLLSEMSIPATTTGGTLTIAGLWTVSGQNPVRTDSVNDGFRG